MSFTSATGSIYAGKTLDISSLLTKTGITGNVTYSSLDESIATVNSTTGVVTGVAEGSTYIYAKSGAAVAAILVTISSAPSAPTITPNGGDYKSSSTLTATFATATDGATLYYKKSANSTETYAADGTWTQASSFTATEADYGTFYLHAVAVKDGTASNVTSSAAFSYTPVIAKPTLTYKATEYTTDSEQDYYGKEVTVTINTPAGVDGIVRKWASSKALPKDINPTSTSTTASYSGLDDTRVLTAYAYKEIGEERYFSDAITMTFTFQKETAHTLDYEETGNQSRTWYTNSTTDFGYDVENDKPAEVSGASYPGTTPNQYGKYTNSSSGGSRSIAYSISDVDWGSSSLYFVEFDLMNNNGSNTNAHEFVLLGEEPTVSNNNAYNGAHCLFRIDGKKGSDGYKSGNDWFLNSTEQLTLTKDVWYHFKFTIKSDKTIAYEVTKAGGEVVATGSDTFTTDNWHIQGIRALINRGNSYFGFDNLKITKPAPSVKDPVISTPATTYSEDAAFTVNASATAGTLYYKTTLTADTPGYTLGDDTWTSAEGGTLAFDAKNYGTFWMHVVAVEDGETSRVVSSEKYTFTPNIAKPAIKVGDEDKTDGEVAKTDSRLDATIVPAAANKPGETYIWYRWGEKVYTKAEMAMANCATATTTGTATASYVGFETSEKLTAVAARRYGNGEYYWSEPVSLTVTAAEPTDTVHLMHLDYNKKNNPAVWTTSYGGFTRNNTAGTDADYYGEYTNTEGGPRPLALELFADDEKKQIYWIEFDAAFNIKNANQNSELVLLGENAIENTNLYNRSGDLFKMIGQNNRWKVNGTEQTMPLENGAWYHYKFVIDESSNTVGYRISTKDGKVAANGEGMREIADPGSYMLAKSLRLMLAASSSVMQFDNLVVWTRTSSDDCYLYFTTNEGTAELTELAFSEPRLEYAFPSSQSNAVISFTTDNSFVGRINYNRNDDGNRDATAFKTAGNRMNSDGDLLLKNPGVITVTATMYEDAEAANSKNAEKIVTDADGNKMQASYTVTVKAGTADFDIAQEGNTTTYKLTKGGKLLEREVNLVPGITMEFGRQQDSGQQKDGESDAAYEQRMNELNTTIVRYTTADKGYYYATTLGQDGWRDLVAKVDATTYDTDKPIPVEGTYYKFTPLTDGKLSFTGSRDGGTANGKNSVVLVKYKYDEKTGKYSDYELISAATIDEDGLRTRSDISLEAGYVYFLYGNNPTTKNLTEGYQSEVDGKTNYQYTTFQMQSFSYAVDFHFDDKSVTLPSGQTTYSQTAKVGDNAASGVTYSITPIGGASATLANSSSPDITEITGGGAIIVTATKDGYSVHYAITVPYTTHKWDFDDISKQSDPVGYIKQYTSNWKMKYKLESPDPDLGNITKYVNNPVLTNRDPLTGDNALYIPMSAGLVINATGEHFGPTVSVPTMKDLLDAALLAEIGNLEYQVSENSKMKVRDLTAIQYLQWRATDEVKNSEEDAVKALYLDSKSGEYLKERENVISAMYNYNVTDNTAKKPDLMALRTGAKVTIPQVKPGSYIRIHMDRYTGNNGEHFSFENMTDLDGTKLKGTTNYGITGIRSDTDGPQDYPVQGAYVFKVVNDADPSDTETLVDAAFWVNDHDGKGWADIYDIELLGDSYITEMVNMATDEKRYAIADDNTSLGTGVSTKKVYTGATRSDFSKKGALSETNCIEIPIKAGSAYARFARVSNESFEIVADEGVEYEFINVHDRTTATKDAKGRYSGLAKVNNVEYNLKIKVTACPRSGGNLKFIQYVLDTSGQYVVDRTEQWFSVGYVESQDYPLTWDFTKRNIEAPASGFATAIAENAYKAADAADNTKTYGAWDGQRQGVSYGVKDLNGAIINKPIFASGADLSTGTTVLAEAKGLGVSLNALDADNTNGVEFITTGDDKYQGHLLFHSAGSLTVPDIEATSENPTYIYIQANQEVTATDAAGNEVTAASGDFAPAEGAYGFVVTTSTDVTLSIPANTQVKRVGVTNITKSIDETGLATESRNKAIDHHLTGEFVVRDVNAYTVTKNSYKRGFATVSKSYVETAPAYTGLLLQYLPADDEEKASLTAFSVPFFYPGNNVKATDEEKELYDDSMLRPHVEAERGTFKDETEDEEGNGAGSTGKYTRFGLTRYYYTYYKETDTYVRSNQMKEKAFVRMKGNNSGNFGANLAYMRVEDIPLGAWNEATGSAVAAKVGYIFLSATDWLNPETTGVGHLDAEPIVDEGAGKVYYTLSGVRLNGKPQKAGVYICNGKKVYIK